MSHLRTNIVAAMDKAALVNPAARRLPLTAGNGSPPSDEFATGDKDPYSTGQAGALGHVLHHHGTHSLLRRAVVLVLVVPAGW